MFKTKRLFCCAHTYKSEETFRAHRSKHHSKQHQCPECEALYTSPVILKKHMQVQHNSEQWPVQHCDQCSYKTHIQDKFLRHLNTHLVGR